MSTCTWRGTFANNISCHEHTEFEYEMEEKIYRVCQNHVPYAMSFQHGKPLGVPRYMLCFLCYTPPKKHATYAVLYNDGSIAFVCAAHRSYIFHDTRVVPYNSSLLVGKTTIMSLFDDQKETPIMSIENPKLEKVNPLVETAKHVRGTEPGNFYLILFENAAGLVGFRPLARKYANVGETPLQGVSTRVRVVPTASSIAKNGDLIATMRLIGFELRGAGDSIHFSQVSSNPSELVTKATTILKLINA